MKTDSEWKDFAFSYWYKGGQCGFTLLARNSEEAQERLRSLSYNAKLEGQVIKVISNRYRWWHRIYVPLYIWWYNRFHKED